LWLHLGLAAMAVLALLFAMSQMLDNRRAALVKLQSQVDASHEQARQAMALSKQLEEVSAGTDFLGRKRAETPPMLAVLADVSARVPDNTFIERFAEQQGQVYLSGLSADAAGLVAKLQASKLLRSPALSGSVQPDALSKRDRFTLVAELVGTRPKGTDNASAQP
jgi:general secretion pathway protein L